MSAVVVSVSVVAVAVVLCWAILWGVGLVVVVRTNDTAGLRDVAKVIEACRGVFSFSLRGSPHDGSDSDPAGGGNQAT